MKLTYDGRIAFHQTGNVREKRQSPGIRMKLMRST